MGLRSLAIDHFWSDVGDDFSFDLSKDPDEANEAGR
jgi:hypothetical protein